MRMFIIVDDTRIRSRLKSCILIQCALFHVEILLFMSISRRCMGEVRVEKVVDILCPYDLTGNLECIYAMPCDSSCLQIVGVV